MPWVVGLCEAWRNRRSRVIFAHLIRPQLRTALGSLVISSSAPLYHVLEGPKPTPDHKLFGSSRAELWNQLCASKKSLAMKFVYTVDAVRCWRSPSAPPAAQCCVALYPVTTHPDDQVEAVDASLLSLCENAPVIAVLYSTNDACPKKYTNSITRSCTTQRTSVQARLNRESWTILKSPAKPSPLVRAHASYTLLGRDANDRPTPFGCMTNLTTVRKMLGGRKKPGPQNASWRVHAHGLYTQEVSPVFEEK